MDSFILNGIEWGIKTVGPDSPYLIDRTHQYKLATTDPNTLTVYLSENIPDSLADRVLIHEIGHCVIFSYGLFDYLHEMVKPEYWIDIEEWVCNFLADYGLMAYSIAKTIHTVPAEMEKLVA